MAEELDRESRTEDPTEKRISEAVDKGNVPFSREVVAFGSLAGTVVVLKLVAPWAAGSLVVSLGQLLSQSGSLRLEDRADVSIALSQIGLAVARAVLPLLAILAGSTVIAALAQNLPQMAGDRIAPKFSRLSPIAGAKKMFSLPALIEFLKSLAKVTMVVVVTVLVIKSWLADILNVIAIDVRAIPSMLLGIVIAIVVSLTGLSLVLAGADFVWSRFRWRRDLRMTKQEVKEEHKQQEGDPFIKMRIRNVARQRTSRRMMGRLPEATLIVANPTHYAVALRYLREEGGAPVAIAKGLDHLALRIRERAEVLDIPVVENKPLARALYDSVEIDQEIPAEFYKAVAEIIHFLQQRKLYTAPAATGSQQPRTRLPS